MPEEKQDPANTQMFRAFVERGEPAPSRGRLLPVLIVVVLVVAAVVGVALALS
jgi:flagellar basal body-associated protein FliL